MKHNKYRVLAILLAAIMMAQAPVSVKATGGYGTAGVAAVGSGMEDSSEEASSEEAAPETTKVRETEAPETEASQAPSESEQPQSDPAESTKAEQGEPEIPAVPSGEDATEAYVEPGSEPESSSAGESSQEKTTKASKEETTEAESSTEESSSVAETLGPIVHDYIIEPELTEDFRFTKIDAVPAILKPNAEIRTEKKESADTVAKAKGTAIVYLIEKGREWCFVESEYIRGYAKRSDLILGDAAKESLARREAWEEDHAAGSQSSFGYLEEKISYLDNPAFADIKETTMEVQADKVYAIATEDILIYDNQAAAIMDRKDLQGTQVLGVLAKGGLAYILRDDGGKTVFVESSDVRGFVNRDLLETGKSADKKVESKGETKFTQAQQKVDVEDNPVLYYTVLSVEKPGDAVRAALVKFALQFVGNPYLWGGTSLTHGTDCSGFTQSVYRHFGYEIPRTSGPQANFGTNMGIKPEYAKPGDIVCYAGHVAIYIGDGKIVHASNSKRYPAGGIKVSDVDIMTIIAIRRIIP